jgi:hypothetical protein
MGARMIAAAILAAGTIAISGSIVTTAAAPGAGTPPATPGASPAPAAAAPPISLASTRTITIPGTRLISMSPDGRWLVGSRPIAGGQHGQLCVFDVVTLAERSCADLSVLDAGLRLEDVAWSPDGSHLAFSERAFQVFLDGDLWLMDDATGTLTNLLDDGFRGKLPIMGGSSDATVSVPVNPAFSPDGRTIAFSRSIIENGRFTGNDIATVPVTGGGATSVHRVSDATPAVVYEGIRWSVDGTVLYYSYGAPDRSDPSNGVWRVGVDGSGAHRIAGPADDRSGAPAIAQVAPGGTLLLWYPARMAAFAPIGPLFALVGVRGGTPRPIDVTIPDAPATAYVSAAVMSVDGSTLLTVDQVMAPTLGVTVRPVAGGVEVPLVPDGLAFAGPAALGVMPTWATNGTVWIGGGAKLDSGTLLTLANPGTPASPAAGSGPSPGGVPTAMPSPAGSCGPAPPPSVRSAAVDRRPCSSSPGRSRASPG